MNFVICYVFVICYTHTGKRTVNNNVCTANRHLIVPTWEHVTYVPETYIQTPYIYIELKKTSVGASFRASRRGANDKEIRFLFYELLQHN